MQRIVRFRRGNWLLKRNLCRSLRVPRRLQLAIPRNGSDDDHAQRGDQHSKKDQRQNSLSAQKFTAHTAKQIPRAQIHPSHGACFRFQFENANGGAFVAAILKIIFESAIDVFYIGVL